MSTFLRKCAHIYPLPIYVLKVDHRPLPPLKKNSLPPENHSFLFQTLFVSGLFKLYLATASETNQGSKDSEIFTA